MEGIEKDEEVNKIKGKTLNNTGGIDYILENGTWLGESFNFLPAGIIDKRETGIGATTLELRSLRHSIIIEPLRITVTEKAINNNEIFAFLVDEKDINVKLHQYLNNEKIKFKKILLVVDNLERLVLQLDKSFQDFFLLFDEIDYMQSSSSYRNLMEYAIDIGKAHQNFAVVSATLIDFSDPDIKKLPVFSFAYEKTIDKKVFLDFYHSPAVNGFTKKKHQLKRLYSYIAHTLVNSEDKILVALNSINAITDITAQLVDFKIIPASEITLLISETPNNTFLKDRYSGKKITEKKLPTKLNFITSAYFNGYDLEDNYRLFIFSSPPYGSSMLSINEIKQIYGRNRNINGVKEFVLFAHDIKIDDIKNPELMDLSNEQFIEMANTHVDFANCFDKHLSKKVIHSDKIMEIFSEGFRNNFDRYLLNFSRKKLILDSTDIYGSLNNPLKKKYVNDIAYFKIDYLRYILSIQKNTYLVSPVFFDDNEIDSYSSQNSIIISLENIGFKIYFLLEDFEIMPLASDKKTEQEMIEYSLDNIKKLIKANNVNQQLLSRTEKIILDIITEGSKVFTVKSLHNELEKITSVSSLKALKYYVNTYSDFDKHIVIREVKHNFKINVSYSSDELILLASKVLKATTKNTNDPKNYTDAKEVIQLAYTLVNKRERDRNKTMKSVYILKKGSPYRLVKKKKK
jgi:hypothetical protein